MDPISVLILAAIYAALRAPGEAGRAVRQDYRNRRGRWNSRAEHWTGARGRGGRRVAGYDRNRRAYRQADRRNGARRGDPGWWRDDRAWRGREGRARVARGVRPSALRTGIAAGALAYTAVFGLGVAGAGFYRGLRGGYRMGKLHYRGKRMMGTDPTVTVAPGQPGDPTDPHVETVVGEVVDGEVIDVEAEDLHRPEAARRAALAPSPDPVEDIAPQGPAGWRITVFAPGASDPVGRIDAATEDEVDKYLAVIAQTPGLRAEVRELADLPEDSRPGTSSAGSTPIQGDNRMTDTTSPSTTTAVAQYIPVGGASIAAPQLMEGANYDAHLHNLNVLAKEARAEYSSAELTLASASAARQRAENDMAAVELMAAGLAAQDFGEVHVGNMASLHELLTRQVAQARAAEQAAQESLNTTEQVIELCVSAAAVFQRDHGQLAEAHANAPHAAKTREAYQPL